MFLISSFEDLDVEEMFCNELGYTYIIWGGAYALVEAISWMRIDNSTNIGIASQGGNFLALIILFSSLTTMLDASNKVFPPRDWIITEMSALRDFRYNMNAKSRQMNSRLGPFPSRVKLGIEFSHGFLRIPLYGH